MKHCLLPVLLLAAWYVQAQLPCFHSNTPVLDYSINGKPAGDSWWVMPEVKPDILRFGAVQKNNRVVFYSDTDSFVCRVKRGEDVRFYVLLNGRDSALTQVSAMPATEKPAVFSRDYIARNRRKSGFEIPEVQELVLIVMALTPTGAKNSNLIGKGTAYYREVIAHFGPWRQHPVAAALDRDLALHYGHLKMNACGYVFDGDRLRKDQTYDRISWSDWNTLMPFIDQLEDFARQSGFREFYRKHRTYYDSLLADAEKYMPLRAQQEWCEREFPDRYDHCRATFSPLVNGWHSTNRFEDNGFRQMMLFVCGTEGREPDVPEKVWEGLMTRVTFTEMDHNYVNPVSDGYLEQIGLAFRNRAFWADPERTAGYETAYAVFNEYLTWAAFTLYAREHFDDATFQTVNTWTERQMTEWRGFIRFREFNRQVLELYRKRPAGKKLYELYPEILKWAESR